MKPCSRSSSMGDGLDEGIFLVVVLDLRANRLDELEEVLGLDLLFVDEEQVGEDSSSPSCNS